MNSDAQYMGPIAVLGIVTKDDYFAGSTGNPALVRYDAASADPHVRMDVINQVPYRRGWVAPLITKAIVGDLCVIQIQNGEIRLMMLTESIPYTECP